MTAARSGYGVGKRSWMVGCHQAGSNGAVHLNCDVRSSEFPETVSEF